MICRRGRPEGVAKMKLIALAGAAFLAASMTAPALADAPKKPRDASIPFVNHGGIQDWRAVDDHTLYIQARGRQWFKAETMGSCTGMNFVDHIGFDAGTTDTLDRFSRIVVRGQPCPIQSLVKVAGPPPGKAKSHKT